MDINNSSLECPICQEEKTDENIEHFQHCVHFVCKQCSIRFKELSNRCPICRTPLEDDKDIILNTCNIMSANLKSILNNLQKLQSINIREWIRNASTSSLHSVSSNNGNSVVSESVQTEPIAAAASTNEQELIPDATTNDTTTTVETDITTTSAINETDTTTTTTDSMDATTSTSIRATDVDALTELKKITELLKEVINSASELGLTSPQRELFVRIAPFITAEQLNNQSNQRNQSNQSNQTPFDPVARFVQSYILDHMRSPGELSGLPNQQTNHPSSSTNLQTTFFENILNLMRN